MHFPLACAERTAMRQRGTLKWTLSSASTCFMFLCLLSPHASDASVSILPVTTVACKENIPCLFVRVTEIFMTVLNSLFLCSKLKESLRVHTLTPPTQLIKVLPLLFLDKQINVHKNWRKLWKEHIRKRESNNYLFPQEWSGRTGKGTQTLPSTDKVLYSHPYLLVTIW